MLSVDSTNNCNTALQDKLQVCESIVHVSVVCWQYQQLQHCITRQTAICVKNRRHLQQNEELDKCNNVRNW